MPTKSLTCCVCNEPMWKRAGSRPQGEAKCHKCRRANPPIPRPYRERRTPDLTCCSCGGPMWSSRTSKPQGQAKCLPCRQAQPALKKRPSEWPIRSRGFCAGCAHWFEATGNSVRYCSRGCRNRLFNASRKRTDRPRTNCQTCGIEFEVDNNRDSFCSRECHRESLRAHKWEWRCMVPWAECLECRAPFAKRGARLVCSQECARRRTRRIWREQHPATSRVWFPSCIGCGVTFCARSAQSKRCGPCKAKAAWLSNGRRHKFGKKVSQLLPYIGHRDRWICGICGLKVKRRDYDCNDRYSPTIDHIEPVSADGSDDPKNLRLAHMICNSRRQNLGGGEQLALVG